MKMLLVLILTTGARGKEAGDEVELISVADDEGAADVEKMRSERSKGAKRK